MVPPILSTGPAIVSFMAPICVPILKTISLAPIHSSTTFIVLTQSSSKIIFTRFLYVPYKVLPTILHTHHFLLFVGLWELAFTPEVFLQTLF